MINKEYNIIKGDFMRKMRFINLITIFLTLTAVITIYSFSVRILNDYHNQNLYEAELVQKRPTSKNRF